MGLDCPTAAGCLAQAGVLIESRGLGSNECCQHAAAWRTWSTEGHTKVTGTQGQVICPLLSHTPVLQSLQLPILATCQPTEAGVIDC